MILTEIDRQMMTDKQGFLWLIGYHVLGSLCPFHPFRVTSLDHFCLDDNLTSNRTNRIGAAVGFPVRAISSDENIHCSASSERSILGCVHQHIDSFTLESCTSISQSKKRPHGSSNHHTSCSFRDSCVGLRFQCSRNPQVAEQFWRSSVQELSGNDQIKAPKRR